MMHARNTKVGIGAAVMIAVLTLSGCIVTARPAYEGPVVAVAPPPPQVEVVGVAPYPGYVWFGGF
jgi:hypothetical protein